MPRAELRWLILDQLVPTTRRSTVDTVPYSCLTVLIVGRGRVAAYCLQRKKERKEGTLTDSTVLQKEKALHSTAVRDRASPRPAAARLPALRCAQLAGCARPLCAS
jgi:hypothetical protein